MAADSGGGGSGRVVTPPPTLDLPPSGSDDEGRLYEVQPGDTLSTIAQQVYGDPTAFGIIAAANNVTQSSPLQVGQVLIIPALPDEPGIPGRDFCPRCIPIGDDGDG
ncbi:MAG: LysM peptidoglycan-binding domain-containing protein [Euzebya sp.]